MRQVSIRRGHWTLMSDDQSEVYQDDGSAVDLTNLRPCKLCGRTSELGSPDPCIGDLPGAWSACCGHGLDRIGAYNAGWVQLNDARVIVFSGVVGGERIRLAVDAALNHQPLPEGFSNV